MTAALMQASSTDAAWDFGSVFAALGTPPVNYVEKNLPDHRSVDLLPPTLSRDASQDNDQTPRANIDLGFSTNLGDFGHAISYLGYSVSVTAPVSSYGISDLTLDETEDLDIGDNTPTRKRGRNTSPRNTNNVSNEASLEAVKVAAKGAEAGRRAVLDSYLGSSPDTNTINKKKNILLKPRNANKWLKEGLSPSSVMPTAITRSRKKASINIAAENKIQLILEMHKRFPEDLYSFSNISGASRELNRNGIHCFVDISNILIGFHDTLKRNRQISRQSRIGRQTLSFHNLSIILERGRPAAKRFLAGSDDIDCTQEARLLGYTTHILQRVDKPDYFRPPGTRKGRKSGLTSSDTDSGTPGRIKRAEQAVDEVLHLGMLQSLLDTDTPSTIVLASGDAAKAEFSDGFLKQVERALLRGWKVEVVAFQATTGFAYRDSKWVSRWGDSFRLIPLDDFAELLHIPYEGSNF